MDPLTALSLFGALAPLLKRLREGIASGETDPEHLLNIIGDVEATKVDPCLLAVAALAEKMPVNEDEARVYIGGVVQMLTGLSVLRANRGG